MARRRRAERWWIGGAVLLCHLVALWAWRPGAPAPRGAPAASPTPLTVQLRPLAPPPARDAVPPSPATRRAATTQRAATPPTIAPLTATAPEAITVEAPAPEAAASAPPLDLQLRLPRGNAAQRGGLTEPPDSMRRAALNDPRGNRQSDPREALPRAVAASAKGDCTKGEYIGGGMGLLSLPFLAVAALRDACKPSR